MRHGRAKAARKTLQFFARTAQIKPPYHVLLDGTFLVALFKYKFPLRERLDKVLQHATFTLYTTKSCLDELEKLKDATPVGNRNKQDLLGEAMKWARRECEILAEEEIPKEFDEETKRMLNERYPELDQLLSAPGFDILKLALSSASSSSNNNTRQNHNHNYFVACQDETILDVLRQAGNVPCMRLARGSVLLLENPSKSGQVQANQEERKKWSSGSVQEKERQLVDLVMEEKRKARRQQSAPQQQQQQQRKKRKAKEPNPLSCKKSKKTSMAATNEGSSSSGGKRRRRRKNAKPESSKQSG